jgi:mannose-6-phosphate isomerase-like protein (cupin superfamily)
MALPNAPELIHVPAGGGEQFAVAGARLNWKVRSADSGADLCCFEQVLEPGEGVPLHTHSYPEAFYVLSGVIDFAPDQAPETVRRCGPGEVILAPARAQHMFFNHGAETARLLSISVGAHERFFDAVEAADRAEPFADLPFDQAMARVAAIGAETDTVFAPPPGASAAPNR